MQNMRIAQMESILLYPPIQEYIPKTSPPRSQKQGTQKCWEKLSHLIKYLHGTRDLPLTLGADNTSIVKWYIDASFAVHPNMRGHTGRAATLGRGFTIVSSTKQKLNTRSSTEAELVGIDDLMLAILWTWYFLKAQGYQVEDNILYRDNRS